MLTYIQIISGVLLGAMILIQQGEGSLGSAFGGGNLDSTPRHRRGPELWMFRATILVAIVFVVSSIMNLL